MPASQLGKRIDAGSSAMQPALAARRRIGALETSTERIGFEEAP